MPEIVESGRRRWYVAIEQWTELESPDGAVIEDWVPLASEWMLKETLNASERFMSDQLMARLSTRFVMPFRSTMDPDRIDVPKTRRLNYAGRQYDIKSAATIGLRERQIELVTETSTRTD
jgi:head-tail adaptor